MALPRDYDVDPGRFRLGVRVTNTYLTSGEGLYARIAGLLGQTGAQLIADIGCGEGALAAAARSPRRQIVDTDDLPARQPRTRRRLEAGRVHLRRRGSPRHRDIGLRSG